MLASTDANCRARAILREVDKLCNVAGLGSSLADCRGNLALSRRPRGSAPWTGSFRSTLCFQVLGGDATIVTAGVQRPLPRRRNAPYRGLGREREHRGCRRPSFAARSRSFVGTPRRKEERDPCDRCASAPSPSSFSRGWPRSVGVGPSEEADALAYGAERGHRLSLRQRGCTAMLHRQRWRAATWPSP